MLLPIASPDHPVKTYSLFGVALRVTVVPFLNVPLDGKTEPPSGGFTLISKTNSLVQLDMANKKTKGNKTLFNTLFLF